MEETTVVVTGGASGLGRAIAAAFAAEGATVVVGARDADGLETTVAALEDVGGRATGLRTDVRDEFDVERLCETASRFGDVGGIDVVVPAATAVHGAVGEMPLDRESYAAFDDHWRTNARGAFATISEALPHLNDDARVLVPTGGLAREAEPGDGSYAVSVAGAAAVARGFAADTDYAVGLLDVGRDAGASIDGGDDEIGRLFVRAARVGPETVDGAVLDRATLDRAEDDV